MLLFIYFQSGPTHLGFSWQRCWNGLPFLSPAHFYRGGTEANKKRLQKELLALQNDPPPGMTLNEKSVQNSITQWIVDMEGAPGTLYEGEKFQLLFKFSSRYPFDSPQRRPPDNSFYVRTCNKNPKKTKWWYHDDTC
ncbi:ubiquitin-conjugating enzyme E2 W isoform X4 [Monodelphis domestica]|uniref:ubiquitin-conjugating enzyme E2 W isoform X4 n=1 Tax=Monodelphis domestica TaxID=13616 RepID=UPI0024E2761B|nr:ubiquitin-conjugating enzyme E2 W isoform X4 [Monodelphis domestica]